MLWLHTKTFIFFNIWLFVEMYEAALAKHKTTVTTKSVPNVIHILLYSKSQKK